MLKDENDIFISSVDDNLWSYHFSIIGAIDSPFENGVYHGSIFLPENYPYGPPTILFLTVI